MSGLCPGCFENELIGSEPCPNCGWNSGLQRSGIHLEPGQQIHNRYILGRVLGQGGFGITYLGFDNTLKTKVAVKEYLYSLWASRQYGSTTVQAHTGKEQDFDSGITNFLEEARTLARLQDYPNIVSVNDFFEANGTAYMVMQYVEGMTFKQYLSYQPEGKLPWREAVTVIIQVMSALQSTHTARLFHRDISPDNIYLKLSPEAANNGYRNLVGFIRSILLDFGNAKHFDAEKSQSFSAVLKEGYAPPEQYSRKGRQGPWTDIYALGATLYKALTGITPPPALDRQHEDDLIPIASIVPDLPPVLINIISKSMSLKVDERIQIIDEMIKPLAQLLGNKVPPVSTPAPSHTILVDVNEKPIISKLDNSTDTVDKNNHYIKHRYLIPIATVTLLFLIGTIGFIKFYSTDVMPIKTVTTTAVKDTNSEAVQLKPEVQSAHISVRTEPSDAQVRFIDPILDYQEGMEIPPGRYRIEVSREGYHTKQETLELIKGLNTSHEVILNPILVALTVNTHPEGAKVELLNTKVKYVDGVKLSPGQYDIEVSAPGYKSHTSKLHLLESEENKIVNFSLSALHVEVPQKNSNYLGSQDNVDQRNSRSSKSTDENNKAADAIELLRKRVFNQ